MSVFIELKGSNFEDAIAQLETSQKGLKEHSKSNNVWIVCLAICKINGTAMKGKKRRVLLDYGATLIVGSKQVIYII